MNLRLSDHHPRFYRLHSSVPTSWDYKKDQSGHWWVGCGRFVFTTMPPSRYEEDGFIRKFLRKRGY